MTRPKKPRAKVRRKQLEDWRKSGTMLMWQPLYFRHNYKPYPITVTFTEPRRK